MSTIVKRGKNKWQAKIRREGWPLQSKIFTTRGAAVDWAAIVESEMARGVFVNRLESESTSLSVALDRYRDEVTILKKSRAQESKTVDVWKRTPLAIRSLASLRSSDFAKYRDQCLKEGLAAATIRNRLALVSHLYTVARSEWGMEGLANPIQNLRKPRADNSRDRRLSPLEEQYLLAALDEPGPGAGDRRNVWMPAIVRLALETALRQEELVKLEWKHVELGKCVARVFDTKNGEDRTIPLSSRSRALLSGLARSISGKVFPTTTSAVKQSWTRAKERARRSYLADCAASGAKPDLGFLDNLWFHDLRHEATSRLVEKGLGILEVASITGHKDLRMLKRYTHLDAQNLAVKLG